MKKFIIGGKCNKSSDPAKRTDLNVWPAWTPYPNKVNFCCNVTTPTTTTTTTTSTSTSTSTTDTTPTTTTTTTDTTTTDTTTTDTTPTTTTTTTTTDTTSTTTNPPCDACLVPTPILDSCNILIPPSNLNNSSACENFGDTTVYTCEFCVADSGGSNPKIFKWDGETVTNPACTNGASYTRCGCGNNAISWNPRTDPQYAPGFWMCD